jgi:FAD/FMN-containing dehydrogenase
MPSREPALESLIEQVRSAAHSHTELEIRGGASKDFYGNARRGQILDVRELTGISSYLPSELVISARAGTPLAQLELVLSEHGQYLPFEPPRFAPGGTVGGMVAAGLAGPARASAGAVRDYLLGATLLNGRAELLTFGGQVMKNVAGYDVSRLMAGSLGVLGVICEVSLKVLPVRAAQASLCLPCDEAQALAQLNRWAAQPLPLQASAWHQGRLTVRLAGAGAAVRAAAQQLGGVRLADEAAAEWWASVRDHRHPFFSLTDAELARRECLWRISLPAGCPPLRLPGDQFIEWGGAQRWWRSTASAAAVRETVRAAGGHATLFRGLDRSAGVFEPLGAGLMRLHRDLKRAFDPQRLFNPGRLYADL